MKQPKLTLLTDKLFLLGLITLLANDFVLKYEIGGPITGKLSDISGLFIFPFFWSTLFEKHRFKIYLTTVFLFVVWKLPISTDFINLANQMFGSRFSRVVDYTDLLTLLVVPFSYGYLDQKLKTYREPVHASRTVPVLIGLIALFAFVATSQLRKEFKPKLEINESYVINVDKEELFMNRMKPGTDSSNVIQANIVDSLFFLHFRYGGHDLEAKVNIFKIGAGKTAIDFLTLNSYVISGSSFFGLDKAEVKRMKSLKRDDYKSIFAEEVIKKLEKQVTIDRPVYYWNPKLDPSILEDN